METWIKILSGLLSAAVMLSVVTPIIVSAKPQTLDNGYQIDFENLPKVHFGEHPEWEELFDATWKSLATTIKKANANFNSKEAYYIDKARLFTNTAFAWDTMFTLMYTKYAQNEFPILPSMDTFYEHQIDDENSEGYGYIPREINHNTGKDVWSYDDVRSMNPPLWAWAEWDLYQTHGDVTQFSREVKGKTVYERMILHYNFIERYKKMESGLYGKTNGYGNGLDNTFNQGAPYKGNDPVTHGNQTYNDLSLQQAQFAYYLSKIAGAMGNEKDKAFFASEHERISKLIIEKMWDEEAHMFSNLDADGVTHTNVSTPTTLWALAAHVATPEQADELVKYHGQNSQKLYRPYGLATTAYDHPGYVPGGDYWRGSFWGPTSYQYIKGLEEYDYDEVALEESIRHLTSILGVWKAGLASGNEAETNPLWENYSSEYLKRGSISNPDYGWVGTVSVGVMIEDILGFKPHAAENTVNWSIRLTEEHGIDDLRYIHNGVENIVSFMAEKRQSAKDPVSFTVIAKEPFTLIVDNGDITATYDVQAGVNLFTIDGESGKAPTMSMQVREFADAKATLTPARFQAAADTVLFSTTADNTIYDGLVYQSGKKAGLIRNVNTIGYSSVQTNNPPRYQASTTMQGLGFAGAQDVVKSHNNAGNEGFMFTLPADNKLRTLTAIVGVQNGTAQFVADVTDGSSPSQTATLVGGTQESVYTVEIPYRASKDGYHVLVKYTLTSSSGSVSLKGILLEDGGDPAPSSITLTPADTTITVDAQAMTDTPADGWNIHWGNTPDALDNTVSVESLPYTLEGLTNGNAYYVALESVSDGVTSARSKAVYEVPEITPLSWKERVEADLEAALPTILNGNTEGTVVNHFVPTAEGPLYKSDITFVSDTDGKEAGVDNNGYVTSPVGIATQTTITVTASHGDVTATRELCFIIPPIDLSNGEYAIAGDPIIFTGAAYLSRDGEKDWMQIIQPINGTNTHAKKKGGNGIGVPRFDNTADPTATLTQSNNSGISYVVTDAATPTPINYRVFEMRGIGNTIEVPMAYSQSVQKALVYVTLYQGSAKVDFLINGQVKASKTVTATNRDTFRLPIAYAMAAPTDKAAIRLTLTDATDNGWTTINAVSLQESDSPFFTIPWRNFDHSTTPEEYNRTAPVSGTIDLTKLGNLDWMQFCQATPVGAPNYARKQNGVGLSDFKEITVVNNANADHQMSTDFNLYYDYTDSDPAYPQPKDQNGILRRGDGNGVQFSIDPNGGKRTLRVYTGNYKARSLLEYVVNDEVVHSEYIDNDGRVVFCTTLMIDLKPGDDAYIRHTLVDQFKYGDQYGCSITYAATLGEFEELDSGTTLLAEYVDHRVKGPYPLLEESSGMKNIGYLDAHRWVGYNIDVEKAGRYDLVLEYATSGSGNVNPGLFIEVDGRAASAEITSLPGTGGWQNFETVTISIELPAGPHTLKLNYTRSGPNLKSLGFRYQGEGTTLNKADLQKLVEKALTTRQAAQIGTGIGEYPQTAANAFDAAIGEAEAVLSSEQVMQVYVNDAITALKKAITAFEESETAFEKEGLNALINQAEKIDLATIHPDRAKALKMALAMARRVSREGRVTQPQVETAETALQIAMDSLKADVRYGDVDGNGAVEAADALLALQASTGKINLTALQKQIADVDDNEGVSAADALLILQKATQKIDTFPKEEK